MRFVYAMWLTMAVLSLAFWGAVIYVAGHFIGKFW